KVFGLLRIPDEVEVVGRWTVRRDIDPYSAAGLAKMEERAKGLLGPVKMLQHLAEHDRIKLPSGVRLHDRIVEDIFQFEPDRLRRAQSLQGLSSYVDALLRNVIGRERPDPRILAGEVKQQSVPRANLQQLGLGRQAVQVHLGKMLKTLAMIDPQNIRDKQSVHVARHERSIVVDRAQRFLKAGEPVGAVTAEMKFLRQVNLFAEETVIVRQRANSAVDGRGQTANHPGELFGERKKALLTRPQDVFQIALVLRPDSERFRHQIR